MFGDPLSFPVKPEPGDLWVAATIVTDHSLKLGLSRILLLGPDLGVKAALHTGDFGMVSGIAVNPATGELNALDPFARNVTRIGADGRRLPSPDLLPGRGLGSMVFLKDGGALAGEHLCGLAPPFTGEGRIARFDAEGRLVRFYRPQYHGGIMGFLGVTHLALLSDQKTVAYVSETGSTVYRYDIEADQQLEPLYVRADPPGMVFGVAATPNDDVLVCCGGEVRRVNSAGEVVRAYATPEGRGWSFLRVTGDGQSFWVGDFFSGALARIDLDSGELIASAKLDIPFGVTSIAEVAPLPQAA
jgi:hypothetical protein